MRRVALLALLLVAAAAPTARAADPGLWRETGLSDLPIVYYQGVTHDGGGNWLFDGIDTGLWRTDRAFNQTGGNPNVIPGSVGATEGYNHIGDLTFDRAEGGRVILPLECYDPVRGNTCNTGSFGVADPVALTWRYYVKLDPAEIPKAMWAEVSPDGSLIWTSSGNDLLAYSAADVKPANAAPLATPIKAVKRLAGAVPPSGITGATFYKGRLFVAGTEGSTKFQVWSIDLTNGSRRLEIEREVVGESEGLDTFDAAGGVLHWLIQPFNTQGPPTYGPNHATLLHFKPAAPQPAAGRSGKRMGLGLSPRRATVGNKVRLKVSVRSGGKPVAGAVVGLAGYRVTTGKRGRAVLSVKFRSPGNYTAHATKRGMKVALAVIKVTGRVTSRTQFRARRPAA
ncbi:MAG: hypothetical protein QOF37_2516 [Thermoleophilaceae bacterium]|jgi:hypothetical protein|nr:hypothetical protein [Thermoleophilaceae bacterium]